MASTLRRFAASRAVIPVIANSALTTVSSRALSFRPPSIPPSPTLLPPSAGSNPFPIVSILGTDPKFRGKRKAFQMIAKNNRRNRHPQTRRRFGWYMNEGMWVDESHIIVNQRALNVYPGENVGVRDDKTLYALCGGNVLTSMEELNPYPDSPLYAAVQNGERIFRLFVHVIPPPESQMFKLVSLV